MSDEQFNKLEELISPLRESQHDLEIISNWFKLELDRMNTCRSPVNSGWRTVKKLGLEGSSNGRIVTSALQCYLDEWKSMNLFSDLFSVVAPHSTITASNLRQSVHGEIFGMEWILARGNGRVRLVINDENADGIDWSDYSTVEAIEQWVAEHQYG